MFEDPDLQDPLSLSLNENYNDQHSQHHDSRKAQESPEYSCETPEIHVVIKEEEDGWTVSENPDESFSSDREKEDTTTDTFHPHLTDSGKESSFSHEGQRQQRGCLVEKCSEELGGPAVSGQSPSMREEWQRGRLLDSEEKPKISFVRRKDPGNVHQCNNSVPESTSSGTGNIKSRQRTHAGDECCMKDQSMDMTQSTSRPTEAELHLTKQLAPYQTDSPENKSLTSHGLKRMSTNIEDQTLHLTVRLQAGEEEEEVEEEEGEEEQDEEIGGLINSDGEVVEWDSRDSPDRGSDCTESPQPSKSQMQSQNQRDSSSPTLIMEVVSVGEDEEGEEGEAKDRVVKMASVSPLYRGKRQRREKTATDITEKEVPTAPVSAVCSQLKAKRRGRRRSSEVPLLSVEELEAEPGISRRTRGKKNAPIIEEPEESDSKTVRGVSAKRPYRRKKEPKPSVKEEGEKSGRSVVKKRPGRKMVQYPVEIPPELLKTPKEKLEYHCSVCSKEFPHAYKLERHELIHTGEKPYCCSICGRGFNQKGNLKTHYKVHLGRKGALEFEDEVNPTASELSEYLKSLPGESRIRLSLRCLECGKECESQSALQAHHITTHSGTAPESDAAAEQTAEQLLFCRRCGIQFSDKEKLEEHLKTHIKEKRYSCPDCGKRFINESYVQVHQRIHTGEKPFLCSQCGRGFHTASSLKLHEMQHSGERPFACAICGKSFRINSYLTAHYQTHIKDRPFICSVCGKGYSRAEELKVHHRLHTGERPYECAECGKSFIYRQGLRQHQRTHAGRRIGPTRQLGRPKQEARLDIVAVVRLKAGLPAFIKPQKVYRSDADPADRPYPDCIEQTCRPMAEIPAGKVAIPALAVTAYTAKKSKHFKTLAAKQEAKKALDDKRSKTRVNIGRVFDKWRELRDHMGLRLDCELAVLLMDRDDDSSDACVDEQVTRDNKDMRSQRLDASSPQVDVTLCSSDETESVSSLEEEGMEGIGWDNESDSDYEPPFYVRIGGTLRTKARCPKAVRTNKKLPAVGMEDTSDSSGVLDTHTVTSMMPETLQDVTISESPGPFHYQEHLQQCCAAEQASELQLTSSKEMPSSEMFTEVNHEEHRAVTLEQDQQTSTGDSSEWLDPEHTSSHEQPQEKSSEEQKQHQLPLRPKKTLNCPTCGRAFPSSGALRRHLVIHSGKRPYKCFICGRGFTQGGNLKTHMKTHKGELSKWALIQEKSPPKESPLTVHLCGECGMEFPQKEQLEDHRQTHIKPYSCPDCGKTFKNERLTLESGHISAQFVVKATLDRFLSKFTCEFTPERNPFEMGSENPEDLGPAVNLAEEDPQEIGGLINSDGEEVDFSDLRDGGIPGMLPAEPPSKTFVQSENEKPPTIHSCSVCGKDFPYASKLQRHLRTHSGERPFPCSMCEKRFPEKGLLMIHERVHTGEKPFPCTFCEKRFASQGELRLHRRTHTGERPYHCSICLKSFSRHWHLKTHLEAMHCEVVAGFVRKKFPCSDCEKSCNSAAELRDHQRTHTGERPYQCSFCDKRFALSGTLVRHERLHTGITPYHCTDCGKTFAQQWTLTTHMRTHTGEKPYSCTQCDKSFVAPGELRRHTRIHTGEKPYTCADCGRHFSLAGTLRNHKRSCTQNKNVSVTGVLAGEVQADVGESSQQDHSNPNSSEVSDSQSSPCVAEPHSSESLNCDQEAQSEDDLKEEEDPPDAPSSPHMNVIVKEEEEEEPLCVGDAPDPVSTSQDRTMEEEDEEQQEEEESNTDIRITVKEEEEEPVNMSRDVANHVTQSENDSPSPSSPDHKTLNNNVKKSSYCCGLCGRDCHKMSALQIHMRIHSGEKPYQCTVCGKQFTQKGQLKGHQKVHTGEKPFSCPDCGKSFAHSGAMNRHRLTHTGERPYHCSVCDRSFNQSGRLREHEKIHYGEKFDCPECEKSFTRASSLKNHFRLHTGERPYGCDICGRGFSRSQSLRLHRRKHDLNQTEEESAFSGRNDDLSQSDDNSPINMCITERNES
ncbi:uncharacterized protein LOC117815585 [Notolabrus celidotus]|uniref:uncharacterized protein LOC117815585 n=1 Tax=Notolabrus celidotus TaxID=1203425 RepID=UPI001490121C|nr:uncharacterized protein LOC117815585 [Notolabrus celidotus]